MATKKVTVRLVYPHQLFSDHFKAAPTTHFILIEDDLFFRLYNFHVQKKILHRASLQWFCDELIGRGFSVHYIETSAKLSSKEQLSTLLSNLSALDVEYYDVVDDWLERDIKSVLKQKNITPKIKQSPLFLTSSEQLTDYFSKHPLRMQPFYEWQRKRLSILIDDRGRPVGGKWNYDASNRKKLPKTVKLPAPYTFQASTYTKKAIEWVRHTFPDSPGNPSHFSYPITHQEAEEQLMIFLEHRLEKFGPYEDAFQTKGGSLFHSVLSAPLNIGLLTPHQIVKAVTNYCQTHTIPIESTEGFIRQIIGWREYVRAVYQLKGRKLRISNHLNASRSLDASWWNGTTGLQPLDDVIKSTVSSAYAHHIERLMVIGNAMTLMRIRPDDAYEWFMTFFIDAYDWVMVPNIYGMALFAAGDFMTTKPYVSGSNYLLSMSDYPKGDWAADWDGLFWEFIKDHKTLFENNYRSKMMARLYENMKIETKRAHHKRARKYLV